MQQRWNPRLVLVTVLQTLAVALAVFILAWALVRLSICVDKAYQAAPISTALSSGCKPGLDMI